MTFCGGHSREQSGDNLDTLSGAGPSAGNNLDIFIKCGREQPAANLDIVFTQKAFHGRRNQESEPDQIAVVLDNMVL